VGTAGSLDITNTAPKRLRALGISVNFYGQMLGIASGDMSNILSGKKRISGTKSHQLSDMMRDLEMVASAFSPAPVSFKDTTIILDLIRQLKSGELLVGTVVNGTLTIAGFDIPPARSAGGW
jgi:hypothetical protein